MTTIKFSVTILNAWINDLIRNFEGDIKYDNRALEIKLKYSTSFKKLKSINVHSLRLIINHLKSNPPPKDFELAKAWGMLLFQIEDRINPELTGPQRFDDILGWIKWAEKFAEPL